MLPIDICFRALAPYAELIEPILGLAERGAMVGPTSIRTLASAAGISSARLPRLGEALQAAVAVNVFKECARGDWVAICSTEDAAKVRLMLHGVNVYLEQVHESKDAVTVVVSKPALPSQLVGILESTLEGFSGMQTTANALIGLAERAQHRFTVMTPFVDDAGIARILELYATTGPNVSRELIVRRPFSVALQSRYAELNALGVNIHDFRISRQETSDNETFHAKVIRIDDSECYVGSSNMTQWSFNYSLELGVIVRGEAGRRISQILDAVVSVSERVQLPQLEPEKPNN